MKKVICSDCGHKFIYTDDITVCPNCAKTIVEVKASPTTDDFVAIVE